MRRRAVSFSLCWLDREEEEEEDEEEEEEARVVIFFFICTNGHVSREQTQAGVAVEQAPSAGVFADGLPRLWLNFGSERKRRQLFWRRNFIISSRSHFGAYLKSVQLKYPCCVSFRTRLSVKKKKKMFFLISGCVFCRVSVAYIVDA